jgi:hypothetical protein
MVTLTFEATFAGLFVPVMIGWSGEEILKSIAQGARFPPPLSATGLIDSGANNTSISPRVVRQLGLPSIGIATSDTAQGSVSVDMHSVSLNIIDSNLPVDQWVTQSNLTVSQLPQDHDDFDVLIGLDILLQTTLFLDGPARKFTLTF